MPRKKPPAPSLTIEDWPIGQVQPYPGNPRTITPAAIAKVASSLQQFGWRQPLVVDESGVLIVGHTRLLAAQQLDWSTVPVHIARGLTPDQVRAYRLADNRSGEESTWHDEQLKAELAALSDDANALAELTGFDEDELAKLLADVEDADDEDLDSAPEPPTDPVSKLGEIYHLGPHRLMCGDCTDSTAVEKLTEGSASPLLLTDPPYCSGGFQEASKQSGSIGSAKTKKGGQFDGGIINDRLSSRGFQALIKATLDRWRTSAAYIFTDWRMWIFLFDIAESSGLGVRNMIVWDKGSAGMGRGWRTQHELLMFAARQTIPFDKHKAQGNVIQAKRTGNELHPTQKPVDLLLAVLNVSEWAQTVWDPFAGSGSTLIAAHESGKAFRGMELSPAFCDVIRRRWTAYATERNIDPGPGALA